MTGFPCPLSPVEDLGRTIHAVQTGAAHLAVGPTFVPAQHRYLVGRDDAGIGNQLLVAVADRQRERTPQGHVSDKRDHVDLDQRVSGNAAGRGNGRAHRRLGPEAALEHLVHGGVVLQVV